MDDTSDDESGGAVNAGSSRFVKFDQETDSVTEAIVAAVADLVGTSQTALDPLYDVIDPDALDRTIRSVATKSSPSDAEIRIRYHGHTVTVHSYGVIEIASRDVD